MPLQQVFTENPRLMDRPRDTFCNFESLEPRQLFAAPAALAGGDRLSMDLSADWKFIRKDVPGAQLSNVNTKKWADVDLPHTYNAVDGANGGNDYFRGGTWYRKTFDLSTKYAKRRVYLNVGAASIKADVYVNGQLAGSHTGAYAAFNLDITGYLNTGKANVIAIRVDNTQDVNVPGYQGDFTNFGGLTRGIKLFATNKLAINPTDYGSSGVKITQHDVTAKRATLDLDVSIRNADNKNAPYSLRTSIVDGRGKIVNQITSTFTATARKARTVEQSLVLKNPHLWNGTADPYLYTAYTQVIVNGVTCDTITTPLGVRSIVMTSNVLLLNGKPLQLHGVNLHDDKQGEGTAMTALDRARDVKLLKQMGANAVRFSHWQVDQDYYDQMDRAGILVWTEIPLWRHVTETPAFMANAEQEMRELIRQNINHPSVFTWGIFNEMPDTAPVQTLLHTMNDLAHAEDPTRFTIGASDLANPAGVNAIPDVIASNAYFGWYNNYNEPASSRIDRLGQFLAAQKTSSPSAPVGLGEFGAGGNITQHVNVPEDGAPSGDPAQSQFHPEEYQSYFHEQSWEAIENSSTPVFGAFVWQFADAANDDREEGGEPGINDKGLLTYDRTTGKDAFYYYKSQWNAEPMLYLTSKRDTLRTDPITTIKVYSNLGSSVELLINGRSLGARASSNGVIEWDATTLSAGQNVVVVRATKDGKTFTDTAKWTYTPAVSPAVFVDAAAATASPKRRDDPPSIFGDQGTID